MKKHGLEPSDVLILLRSDRNGVFSQLISERLSTIGIPVAATTDAGNPLDTDSGRSLLSFLQLAARPEDSLAWRALLKTWCPGIGPGAIESTNQIARGNGWTFAETIERVRSEPNLLTDTHRSRITKAIEDVHKQLEASFPESAREPKESYDGLEPLIQQAAETIIIDQGERQAALSMLNQTWGGQRV